MGRFWASGLALAVSLLVASATYSQTTFGGKVSYAVGDGPCALIVGDLDCDGLPDLATSDWRGATLSVLYGALNGTFGDLRSVAVDENPGYLGSADFNADGLPDLCASSARGRVRMVYNGPGRAWSSGEYVCGGNQKFLVCEDFNGDTLTDVATTYLDTSSGVSAVMINYGQVGGGLGSAVSYAVATWPKGITVGDFNLDGRMDIVTAGFQRISLLYGNTKGGFDIHKDIDKGGAGHSEGITAADLNNDGRADFVVADWLDNTISLLYSQSNGDYLLFARYSTAAEPRQIACADFNRDSFTDIAVTTFIGGTLEVFYGLPNGGFGNKEIYTPGTSPIGILADDFDNNGWMDLAATAFGDDQVVILYNQLPEPATLALLAAGLGAVWMGKRRGTKGPFDCGLRIGKSGGSEGSGQAPGLRDEVTE